MVMNRRTLSFLIAVNVMLMAILTLTTLAPEPAHAQFGGGHQFMMIAGKSAERPQQEVVYIIDMRSSRMIAAFYNTSNNQWQVVGSTTVSQDMGVGAPGGQPDRGRQPR